MVEEKKTKERIEKRLLKFNKFIAEQYPCGCLLKAKQDFIQKLNKYENELHQAYEEADLEKATAILCELQKHYECEFKIKEMKEV